MRWFGWLRRIQDLREPIALPPATTTPAIAPPPDDPKDTAVVVVAEPSPPPVVVVETAALQSEPGLIVDTTATPSQAGESSEPTPPLSEAAPTRRHETASESRASYFTPAQYAGMSSSGWLIAPDIAFQLRREAPRQLPASTKLTPSGAVRPAPATESVLGFFASAPARAEDSAAPAGTVSTVDPIELTAFISNPVDEPYLSDPVLLATALALRGRVLDNFSAGKAPLTTAGFLAETTALVSHPGTALLVCHAVAKAFSRGGGAIQWTKSDRVRGEYTGGAHSYSAIASHPLGIARAAGSALPSIFYLLFSASDLGVSDPGHWYRYFGFAALAWYTASGHVSAGPASAQFDPRVLARRMVDSAGATAAYPPWAWANACSFSEGAIFSRSQKRCSAMSRVHLRGTAFGIAQAGRAVDPGWRWYVPKAGSLDGKPANDTAGFTENIAETLEAKGGVVS